MFPSNDDMWAVSEGRLKMRYQKIDRIIYKLGFSMFKCRINLSLIPSYNALKCYNST